MNKQNINNIEVSIIIPAFREEKYIEKTILGVKKMLERSLIKYEIICVVDGFVDKTFEIVLSLNKKYKDKVKVYGYEKNRGKGFALRVGFKKAIGKYIGFIDADGQIDENVILRGLKILKTEHKDIVIGSKKHVASKINYSLFRKLISFLSQVYIKTLFGLGVRDTQAGFKIFRNNVIKKILPRLTVDRFAFDIEALSVSQYLGYGKIVEIPIKVKMLKEDNTNINKLLLFKDIINTLKESFSIFLKLRMNRYYDDSNSINWMKLDVKLISE